VGLSVQQVALWYVCVCVFVCAAYGTVWIKFGGVMVQQVDLWCVCVCLCVCVCVCVCASCWTVWSRFGVLRLQQVVLWCMCVCVCVCCVWDCLEQVCGIECAAGGFVVCVCAFAAYGTVWSRFGGVSVQQVALWCV